MLVSRNFDLAAYRERLSSVPSHYSKYNIPEGYTEAQALELKQMMPSAAMSMSQPPRQVYISHGIRKKINGGASEAYRYKKHGRAAGGIVAGGLSLAELDGDESSEAAGDD